MLTQQIGYTEKDIVNIVGISQQAVSKKLQKNSVFFIGTVDNPKGGRPIKVYRKDVLTLWKIEKEYNVKKQRSHFGRVQTGRGRNQEVTEYVTGVIFQLFLENAMGDVYKSCNNAKHLILKNIKEGICKYDANDVLILFESDWIYKRWIKRSDAKGKGVYYKDNWKNKWFAHNKKWSNALSKGTMRHDMWRIMENDFGAQFGKGGRRIVGLDDRQTDVWIKDKFGNVCKRYAVYAWDLLTGELLHIEPAETVTSETYIKTILSIVFKYGCDCPLFSMENAAAAVANRVKGVIRSLYTEKDLQLLSEEKYRLILKDDVVSRNVPHVPKGLFKGLTESNMRELKSHDAMYFPRSFQGGNKSEQIELRRSNQPTHGEYTPDEDLYFSTLRNYADTLMITQERKSLKVWAETHGTEPTRKAMIEYYKPANKIMPSASQIAYLVYYASKYKVSRKMKNIGTLTFTYEGIENNITSIELWSPEFLGKKLEAVPMPGTKRESGRYKEWLVYEPKTGDEFPVFIGVAHSAFAETIRESFFGGLEMRKMREESNSKLLQDVNYNFSENKVLELKTANIPQLSENEEGVVEFDGTATEEEPKNKKKDIKELLKYSRKRF